MCRSSGPDGPLLFTDLTPTFQNRNTAVRFRQSVNLARRQSGSQAVRQSGSQAVRQSGSQAVRQSGSQENINRMLHAQT
ncbi:hypothetical protein GTPT_1966 [Tatumella ptyseos ATCC 33301]|uniref:Uncharacterized protein n=1 Tax=Tatumella ptyseos ATCC 33301 TaxID=1005995 RepID=A0A085JFD3_9GAMM|nr:hypothetical protein GTPT_1966 [Tatumella ptyseos ATCC 33301]